jgi:molybdate transport system regulatory protein
MIKLYGCLLNRIMITLIVSLFAIMEPSLSINGRIWLEINNEKVIGPGRVELLERIGQSGSIRQAALQMKMSYRQAWDLIRHMNEKFDSDLVISHRGGKGGGYAEVTPKGQEIIKEYRLLEQRFKVFMESEKVDL